MARIIYTEKALHDLDRLTDFLLEHEPDYATGTADLIIEAITALENHPYIGRPIENDLRELIISRGRTGYVALYSLERHDEIALIVTIRHQREAGYSDLLD